MRGERPHAHHREREAVGSPARSETPCTLGTSLCENREISGPPGQMAGRAASGRP
jgi:hypothetical protein